MDNITHRKVGAGGFWTVINERRDDSVVKQITPFSCVAAVKELADLLNEKDKSDEKWCGVIVAVKYLEVIAEKSSFGAVLREGNPLGHLALVEGLKENLLTVKDPWGGTRYEMTIEEFLRVWNGEVVLKWNLSA